MNNVSLSYLVGTIGNSNSEAYTTTLLSNNSAKDITTIAGAINDYGILAVIAGAFIVFTILILALFLHMNNTMIKTITKQIDKNSENSGNIANQLVDYVTKENKDSEDNKELEKKEEDHPKHSKDLVKLFIDRETVFKSASKVAFDELKCSRIGIYVFHNGNETPYGLPFIKMSCIFDQGMNGIKTQRGLTHINLPLHYFNDLVTCLYSNMEYYCNIDATDEDDSIRSFAAGSNSKSGFCMAIRNDDTILGFVSCEFSHNIDFGNNEEVEKIRSVLHDITMSIKFIIVNRSDPEEMNKLRPED